MNAPEKIQPETEAFAAIAIGQLRASPTNPRRHFPQDKLEEMAESVRSHGLLQPILIRAWPEGQKLRPDSEKWPNNDLPHYEIIAGERRYRAATMAGLDIVPAMVRTLTDDQVLEIQIIENLQREDVHPLEEAEGYQLLMSRTKCSADDLATKVGKSKAYIYARLKLCAIQGKARDAFMGNKINASVALLIARIPDSKLQQQAAKEVIDGWQGEPMSVRDATEHIQDNYMLRLADAPFPRGDENLVKGAPTCHKCPSRTGNQRELYADVKSADVCTDPKCFEKKREAHKANQVAEAKATGKKVLVGKEAKKVAPHGVRDYGGYLKEGYTTLTAPVYDGPDKKNGDYHTWRELLGKDMPETTLIEDERKGILVEIAKEKDLIEAAKAKGIEFKKPFSSGSSTNDEQKAREKKAKDETTYRTHLLKSILFEQNGAALTEADLREVATTLWRCIGHDSRKLLAQIKLDRSKHEDIDELGKPLETAAPDFINHMLLAMSLIGEVHVNVWQTIRKPEGLTAAAERYGVDLKLIKKQAEILTAPKKKPAKATAAKVQPQTANSDTQPKTAVLGALPNEHGVYTCEPDTALEWKNGKNSVKAELLELDTNEWIYSTHIKIGTGYWGGPLSIRNQRYPTRHAALDAIKESVTKESRILSGTTLKSLNNWLDRLTLAPEQAAA